VHISASHNVLAQRLAQRGRETIDAVAKRLAREVSLALPAHVVSIDNNAMLADSVDALQQALEIREQKAFNGSGAWRSNFTPLMQQN
jgi:ribose 1,5-bisphosphokinase